MSFDDMLGSLLPKKPESQAALMLPDHISIPELYDQWYGLHIKRFEFQERSQLHSDVSFKVIENLASRLSDDHDKTGSVGLAKIDTVGQLAKHKEIVQDNISSEISSIDDQILKIKSSIQTQAQNFLIKGNMQLDLVLTLYSGLTAGKLELLNINNTMGVPLYYLFNDEIPIFNVGDKNLISRLTKHLPEETISNIRSMIPEPKVVDTSNQSSQYRSRGYSKYNKYSRYNNSLPESNLPKLDPFVEHVKNYVSECFGLQVRGYYSIPMFTAVQKLELYSSDNRAKAYRLILRKNSIVSVEKIDYHVNRDDDKVPSEVENLHKINPIFEFVNLDMDRVNMRTTPSVYNTDRDSLIEASSWILAKFAKYGLTQNIKYRETILHINNSGPF